jgi:signal transduction histidine kinase
MHFELNNSNAEPTQEEKIADRISLVQAEKNNAMGVLMSGIAHEINTPLSAIKASSENISLSLKDFIDKISNENSQIRNEEWQLISKILSDLENSKEALSTREIRAKKKELAKLRSEVNKITTSTTIDSLATENFMLKTQNGRYELSLEHLYEVNPPAAKQFDEYLQNETE